MHHLEGKPDSEGLKPALATAIVTIRSRLFQAFLGQGTVELRAGTAKRETNVYSQSDCVLVIHIYFFKIYICIPIHLNVCMAYYTK